MRSIALANQKGGVGKTTTAVHLAHGLALAGRRVALLDVDLQGNATVSVQGMTSPSPAEDTARSVPEGLEPVTSGLWLMPASAIHGAAADPQTAVRTLLRRVEALHDSVDWVVVDCPPRLDLWGWAAMELCEMVVVPVQTEFLAMHGLSQMLSSLEAAADRFPGRARLRGILPTMVATSEPIAIEVLEDLRANLGKLLLESTIVRDAAVVEAASHGKTTFEHCPWCPAAFCYAELTKELLHG